MYRDFVIGLRSHTVAKWGLNFEFVAIKIFTLRGIFTYIQD